MIGPTECAHPTRRPNQTQHNDNVQLFPHSALI